MKSIKKVLVLLGIGLALSLLASCGMRYSGSILFHVENNSSKTIDNVVLRYGRHPFVEGSDTFGREDYEEVIEAGKGMDYVSYWDNLNRMMDNSCLMIEHMYVHFSDGTYVSGENIDLEGSDPNGNSSENRYTINVKDDSFSVSKMQ